MQIGVDIQELDTEQLSWPVARVRTIVSNVFPPERQSNFATCSVVVLLVHNSGGDESRVNLRGITLTGHGNHLP